MGFVILAFMKVTLEKEDKVANMIFASIYQLYLNRLEKNGKTKEELNQILEWFTGFDKDEIQILIEEKVTFRTFFERAKINSNAHLIKGVVCGYPSKILKKNLIYINNAGVWKS